MTSLARTIRERLLPAVLTAAGVTLIGAGLLSYTGSAQANPLDSPDPTTAAASPGDSFSLATLPPIASPSGPSESPSSAPSDRVATRVVIEALGIDLPVVKPRGGTNTYPLCNVAMYIQTPPLAQPGSGRATYIYAHARDGMFGPLYERITLGKNGGAKALIGLPVLVYTSDDHVYEYAITKVYPRVPADSHFLDKPLAVTSETLWLQTSTGHGAELPKLQVEAEPFFDVPASHADAHPKAHPVVCG